MVLTLLGGLFGILLSHIIAAAVDSLRLLGPLFEDTTGKGNIHLSISVPTMLLSTALLVVAGLISGLVRAMRASKLDPATALRHE